MTRHEGLTIDPWLANYSYEYMNETLIERIFN